MYNLNENEKKFLETLIFTYTSQCESDKEKAIMYDIMRQSTTEKNYIESVGFSRKQYINGNNQTFNIEQLSIETSSGEINAIKLSKFKPSLKEIQAFSNLESKDRVNSSDDIIVELAQRLNCRLLSGKVSIGSREYKHKWLSISLPDNDEKKEYYIDYYLNAIINKEAYIRLMNPIKGEASEELPDVSEYYKNEIIPLYDSIMQEKSKELYEDNIVNGL